MSPGDKLETRIEDLKDVWKKCIRKNGRFLHYEFLSGVFDLYKYIRSRNLAELAFEICADYSKRKKTPDTHLFRAILDGTCTADAKLKSRWVRALRYAWRQRHRWDHLPKFFRRNGGISGCAADFTETQRWKRERAKDDVQIPSDNQVRLMKKMKARASAELAARIARTRRSPVRIVCPPRQTVGDWDRENAAFRKSN